MNNGGVNHFKLSQYLKPIVVPGLGSSRLIPPEDAPPRPEARCSGPTLGSCLPPLPLPDITAAAVSGSTAPRLNIMFRNEIPCSSAPMGRPAAEVDDGTWGSLAPAPLLMAGLEGEGSTLGKLMRCSLPPPPTESYYPSVPPKQRRTLKYD